MVLIQDRILKIDIYNFEMSYKTPEKSLKSNQIYSEAEKTSKTKWELNCGTPCTVSLSQDIYANSNFISISKKK